MLFRWAHASGSGEPERAVTPQATPTVATSDPATPSAADWFESHRIKRSRGLLIAIASRASPLRTKQTAVLRSIGAGCGKTPAPSRMVKTPQRAPVILGAPHGRFTLDVIGLCETKL